MTRRILAVFVALLFAALGTAAVLFYVSKADQRAVDDASPVSVLVVKSRIPAGTTGQTIRERDLTESIRLPAGSLPEGAETMSTLLPELDPLVVTSDLQPGQVVLKRMFSQETRTSGGLAIPEGQVAVSFTVSLAEQVAGYVRPGSQVALYTRYHIVDGQKVLGGEEGEIVQTGVLLEKVDVIAVGVRGDDGETTTTPLVQGEEELSEDDRSDQVLVTVAVTAADAAQVVRASTAGAIHLALLGDGAKAPVDVNLRNPN